MWKKIVMGILILISGAAGFLAAKAQVTLYDSLGNINRDYDTVLENVDLEGIKVNSDDDIVNILVVGNDFRKEKNYQANGLTDTMMIDTMVMKHKTLKMTSLMRDCYVQIPDHGYNKLNAANSLGGIALLYKTIALNFNIEVDGYVEVGFDAFEDIVDSVGGVEAELTETEVPYLNSKNYIRQKKNRNVKVGKQILNGDQALAYCRIRKGGVTTANGLRDDYGRTWRQRQIVSAVFDKVKSLPMSKWLGIANKILKHVTTDLSNDKIIEYVKDVVMMGTTKIYQLQIPIQGYFRGSNNEYKVGSCLVMTDGTNPTLNTSMNAEGLKSFIFDYDGKAPFRFGTFESKEQSKGTGNGAFSFGSSVYNLGIVLKAEESEHILKCM